MSRAHFHDIASLRPLRPLHDLELYGVSLIQSFEAVTNDGRVMHKNIRPFVTSDEPIALGIVEPPDRTFHVPVLFFPGTIVHSGGFVFSGSLFLPRKSANRSSPLMMK